MIRIIIYGGVGTARVGARPTLLLHLRSLVKAHNNPKNPVVLKLIVFIVCGR